MALELIPPGKRKGNRFYLIRGSIGQVKDFEKSTKTTDRSVAQRMLEHLTVKLLTEDVPVVKKDDGPKKFREAATAYCNAKPKMSHDELMRLNRLVKHVGHMDCQDIVQDTLVQICNDHYPGQKASSWNRSVITIASYILTYAAKNKWCAAWEISRFEEDEVEAKALRSDEMLKVVAGAEDVTFWALLVFMFNQGLRITQALHTEWERIDLDQELMQTFNRKAKKWTWKALLPDTVRALRQIPYEGDKRTGRVFPWKDRYAARYPLKRLRKATGITKMNFHMARHTLGKQLAGTGLKTKMGILDHADERTTLRYDMSDIQEQRAALATIVPAGGSFPGKVPGKPKKA